MSLALTLQQIDRQLARIAASESGHGTKAVDVCIIGNDGEELLPPHLDAEGFIPEENHLVCCVAIPTGKFIRPETIQHKGDGFWLPCVDWFYPLMDMVPAPTPLPQGRVEPPAVKPAPVALNVDGDAVPRMDARAEDLQAGGMGWEDAIRQVTREFKL